MTTVLVTGAAGRVGSGFVRANAGRYQFHLADRREPPSPEMQSAGKWFVGDLSDLTLCRACAEGCSRVLHLAANPQPMASFEQLLPANLVSTYNVMQAALDAGARRLVFASTIQTVLGYPGGLPPSPDAAPRPVNLYGASKAWGEALCSVYGGLGLSCCAVRIGGVYDPARRERFRRPEVAREIIYQDDLNQLLTLALDADDQPPFKVFYGLSAHPLNCPHIEDARALLGYRPHDYVAPSENQTSQLSR